MLQIKSLDDINFIDIKYEKSRINLTPNRLNVLYRYKSLLFDYEIAQHIPEKYSHLPIKNIADVYARVLPMTYNFADKLGETHAFKYFFLEIWKEIDKKYRDVFLKHELTEVEYAIIKKQPKQVAHDIAKRKTNEYIKKYLNPKEIKGFNKMLKSLPKRRTRKSNVKVFSIS